MHPNEPGRLCARGGGEALRLGLLLCAGLVVYLATLDGHGYWADEVWGLLDAREDVARMLHVRAEAGHQPLYFLGLWHYVRIFGESEFATRLPSVLASFGSVFFLYAIVRRLTGAGTALLAAALLLMSPAHLRYAQETRMYAFVEFLSLASTWVLVRSAACPRPRDAVVFGLFTLANIGTHSSALLVVAAQVGFLVTHRPRPWRLLVGAGVALALYLPWLLYYLPRFDPERFLDWMPPLTWDGALRGPGRNVFLGDRFPIAAVVTLFMLAVGLLGARAAGRRGAALAWVAYGSLAAGLFASVLGLVNAFATPRYLLASWAALLGLGALAVRDLVARRRAAGLALAGILLALPVVGWLHPLRADHRFDARRASHALASHRQETEAVLHLGDVMTQAALGWYFTDTFFWLDPDSERPVILRTSLSRGWSPHESPLPTDGTRLWVVAVRGTEHLLDPSPQSPADPVHPAAWDALRVQYPIVERIEDTGHGGSLWVLRR